MSSLKYSAAYLIPITAFFGVFMKGYWSFLSMGFVFIFLPLLEVALPVDRKNPEGKEIEAKSKNRVFDWLLYLNFPMVFSLLVYALIETRSVDLATYEIVGIVSSLGSVLAVNGINIGHELGHRQKSKVRFLGKLLLLPSLYTHFYIEHNFGHHKHVATKEDPATARFNQPLYSFWITSVFGQYISAWKIQKKLLSKKKNHFFSFYNDMLWGGLIQLGYLGIVYFFFGEFGLLIAVSAAIVGILDLETVNYVEHYGLMRKKKGSGKYERVGKIHSWNSNHLVGRAVLFELTRHSDHHYRASKKYQLLGSYEDSPQLPFGYPTSMVLSLIPPLWFKVMNHKIPREMRALHSS